MVPVVDLSRRGRRYADAFAERVKAIASSGVFLLGDELRAFEQEFAAAIGAAHAVGVSSGSSALQLALVASGVRPGDDVLVPAFTAVPTVSAVLAMGAHPVLCDVDPHSACVTAESIATARTPRTTAVIVVHLYGHPADDAVIAACDSGLIVIEDAAQAAGALRAPRRSASVAYSFYPTKNLGGIGDGGLVATDDPVLAETVRRLRVHGMTEQYVHESVSQNFRLSEVGAAWLRLGLADLVEDNVTRHRIATAYRRAAPALRWQRFTVDDVVHLAVFRSGDRAATREQLAAAGVATAIHYPLAITQQPGYVGLISSGPCPEAEAWAAECVTVPCFPEMSDAEIDQVCGALASLEP